MERRALESRRRRQERKDFLDNEMQIAEAVAAASELSSIMDQFTSNKLGSSVLNASTSGGLNEFGGRTLAEIDDEEDIELYQNISSPDPVAWIRQQHDIDKEKSRQSMFNLPNSTKLSAETTPHRRILLSSFAGNNDNNRTRSGRSSDKDTPSSLLNQQHLITGVATNSVATATTTARTPAQLHRASTPVMSNASNTKLKDPPLSSSQQFQKQQKQRQLQLMIEATAAAKDIEAVTTPTNSSVMMISGNNDEYVVDDDNDDYDEDMPVNVQSPWVKSAATPMSIGRSPVVQKLMNANTENYEPTIVFQRYYDALCAFVKSKRSLLRLLSTAKDNQHSRGDGDDEEHAVPPKIKMLTDENLQQKRRQDSNELVVMDFGSSKYNNKITTVSQFANMQQARECQIDVDFLQRMCDIATSSSSSNNTTTTKNGTTTSNNNEGNFWYLLATLRPLGIDAILNEDDRASFTQHQHSVQGYIQSLASKHVEHTQEYLLNEYHQSIGCSVSINEGINKSYPAGARGVSHPNATGGGGHNCNTFMNNSSPFLLRRRQGIMKWLEYCFNEALPYGLKHTSNATVPYVLRDTSSQDSNTSTIEQNHYKNHLSEQGFIITKNDTVLLQHSLSYMVAGRLQDAQQLVRANDSSWRAALWDGGRPHGYRTIAVDNAMTQHSKQITSSVVSTGNQNRALWRRMTWKLADSFSPTKGNNVTMTTNAYEAAIAAILSSNVISALDNPVLNRFWEQGLFVVYRAMLDRTEDEVLHYHNSYRRQMTKQGHPRCFGFPGIFESEKYELEQLKETSNISVLNDAGAIDLVNSRPMQQITKKSTDPIRDATSSVLIGKSAMAEFINKTHPESENMSIDDGSVEYIRFLTHFALYLDSFSVVSTTSATSSPLQDEISQWKNSLLVRYIQHLASVYELKQMMVVYASLLPEAVVLDVLPPLLLSIESARERKVIVQQLEEFLSVRKPGLDFEVVRRVVRQTLLQPDEDRDEDTVGNDNGYNLRIVKYNGDEDDNYGRSTSIARLDMQKMYSILWLTFDDDHIGEALISTNILLRQFLLPDENGQSKTYEAKILMSNVLPGNLLDRIVSIQRSKMSERGEYDKIGYSPSILVEYAQSDFLSVQAYLRAMDALDQWMNVISLTPAITKVINMEQGGMMIDRTKLNESETTIAARSEWMQFIQDKRSASATVVMASDKVERLLLEILTNSGGWLLTDDEVYPTCFDQSNSLYDFSDDVERRRTELRQLRSTLLPKVVASYEDVCSTTAAWMSTSLNDAVEQYDQHQPANATSKGTIQPPTEHYIVQLLDETVTHPSNVTAITYTDNNGNESRESPVSPKYWIQKIFQLAYICTSDAYGICSAFDKVESYEYLIASIANAKIQELMYG